MKIKGTMTSI